MRETIKINTVNTNTNSINWSAELILDATNIHNLFAGDIRSTTAERPADGTPVNLKVGSREYKAVWEIVDSDGLRLRVKDSEVGITVIPPTHPTIETSYRMLQEKSRFLWGILTAEERAERDRLMRELDKELDRAREEQWEKEVEDLAAEIFKKKCSAARGTYLEKIFREACAKLARAEKAFHLWGADENSCWHDYNLTARCARRAYEEEQKAFDTLLAEHREELEFLAEPLIPQTDRDCWGPVCWGCNWWGHATKPCAACGGR